METRDLILRYGFVAGKRYTRRQKLKFLLGFTQDLEELGWRTEAKETTEKNLKNVNLYIGDLGKARVIAEAYYDTPPVSLTPGAYRLFSVSCRRNERMYAVIVPMLLILAAGALFFWKASASLFDEAGRLSRAGVLNVAVLFVLLALMYKCRKGIPGKRNVIRNTSSLLALYRLAEQERRNKRLAFVLTDDGCGAGLGARVLKGRKRRDQIVVHLSCVGAREQLYLLYDSGTQNEAGLPGLLKLCAENGLEALDIRSKPDWKLEGFEGADLYVAAGRPEKDGFFLGKKQLLEAELSEENIEKTTAFLAGLEKILR